MSWFFSSLNLITKLITLSEDPGLILQPRGIWLRKGCLRFNQANGLDGQSLCPPVGPSQGSPIALVFSLCPPWHGQLALRSCLPGSRVEKGRRATTAGAGVGGSCSPHLGSEGLNLSVRNGWKSWGAAPQRGWAVAGPGSGRVLGFLWD